ncbi:NADH-quinone oxidoreductase subunit L [Elioraea sp.]|uniref:NADH-quinone oxidoreductase subunit L n=1 Tax=Elioraea sp. TaxID=2185103 RepID=UPI0025C07196|nr:NADH-quinone oxidoreductase subunit L [Elioraea sp.]
MEAGAVFSPLVGAIIAGFFGRALGDRGAQLVTIGFMTLATLCGVTLFFDVAFGGNARTIVLGTWIDSGSFEASWALRFDTLSAVMVGMVTFIATLIHIYSVGYMSHDRTVPRFMAYLSLFTFAMLMLVTADNLIQLFFGWEGVGLASYLLIGYWYERESANRAAMKAFIVNRVGDVGFALGIAGVFVLTDSVGFDAIFAALGAQGTTTVSLFGGEVRAVELCAVLLFIGAMGKSAQLGLHTWLPDAMEGPTPVSALIHAATMVTAGVFLVARMSPLFELAPVALSVVTIVGASTALFAATIGCVQNDIKRVIAYSTCSQLGYMFFAAGVSAYPAAIFHLFTHAFFKALLFLGAGSVIHAMSDEQDIRRMGGIWKKIPATYTLMWIGNLALAGVPFFSGFYSKDMVLEAAWGAHSAVGNYAFVCGLVAAFLTAFYSWRLLILTFHGAPRADHHVMEHVHESPLVMILPLVLLAIGAVFAGAVFYEPFVGHHWKDFWQASIVIAPGNDALENAHHAPLWVKLLPVVMGASGIATAYVFYMLAPGIPGRLAAQFQGVHRFLLNKWYFDELYDAVFVRPSLIIGRALWKGGDGAVIDGFGPDGIAAAAKATAGKVVKLQTGMVYHYAFAMMIGIVVLVTLFATGRL